MVMTGVVVASVAVVAMVTVAAAAAAAAAAARLDVVRPHVFRFAPGGGIVIGVSVRGVTVPGSSRPRRRGSAALATGSGSAVTTTCGIGPIAATVTRDSRALFAISFEPQTGHNFTGGKVQTQGSQSVVPSE